MVIADSVHARRVLGTTHPPVDDLPPADIQMQDLRRTPRDSACEWQGLAAYYAVTVNGGPVEDAAWFYPNTTGPLAAIRGCIAFYASRMDACYVDGELMRPEPGGFYGGWIARDLIGPFKGEPGTMFW